MGFIRHNLPFIDLEKTEETLKLKYIFRRIENTLGQGGSTGYHHFLLLQQIFSKSFFLKSDILLILHKTTNKHLSQVNSFPNNKF